MSKFYRKGQIVPRSIVRTWNKQDQKHIRFSTDCCVTGKKVISLKKSYSRLEFGSKTPTRRAQPMKDWRVNMDNVWLDGRYCEYSILVRKFTNNSGYANL